jgi:tetratricopeptide (TPR) repeat protein
MAKKEKLIEKAQKHIQKGYLDKAIGEYKKLVDMDPSDISVRLRLGDLYVKTGKKNEAVKEYLDVAKSHTRKGFYLKAIAVYKQVLKLDETGIDIHNKLADLYTIQRLIADAISEYSYIVNIFEKKGNTTGTLELLKKMVEIDPENVGVKLKLADLNLKLGFDKDALTDYSLVFDKLLSQGKLYKAERIYIVVARKFPEEPKVLEGLVKLYQKMGDKKQFVEYGSRLAPIYKDSGKVKKARALCKGILEVRPDSAKARSILSELGVVEPGEKEPAGEARKKEALISWPEVSKEILPGAEAEEEEFVEVDVEAGTEDIDEEKIELVPEDVMEEEKIEVEPEEMEEEKVTEGPEDIQQLEAVESIEEVEEVEEVPEEAPYGEITESPVEEGEAGELEGDIGGEDVEEVSPDELEEFSETDKTVEDQAEADEEDYVDLSRELGLKEALDTMVRPWSKDATGEAVGELKNGIGRQLSKEDTETHHNLGIAYMEMELYEDAVKEFKIALKDPVFEFESYTRLGLCSMAIGNTDEAIDYYLKALKVKGRSDDEHKGIMYELGLAYEAADKTEEAGGMFRAVYDMDPDYREVSEKSMAHEAPFPRIPTDDSMVEIEIL